MADEKKSVQILTPENIVKTWQENNITVPANQVYPLNFFSTKPNVFIIKNNSNTTVYVSKDNNVDNTKFEVSIPPYGLKLFQKPYSLTSIYFHSDNNADLRVESYEGKFDASDIVQTSGDIAQVNVNTLPTLPAGTNNIGDVDVLTLPSLPAGNNNIGDVDVVSWPASNLSGNNVKVTIQEDITEDYTPTNVTASGDTTVKASGGYVSKIFNNSAVTVILKDGGATKWKLPANSTQDFAKPIKLNSNIVLNLSGTGDVFIAWK